MLDIVSSFSVFIFPILYKADEFQWVSEGFGSIFLQNEQCELFVSEPRNIYAASFDEFLDSKSANLFGCNFYM